MDLIMRSDNTKVVLSDALKLKHFGNEIKVLTFKGNLMLSLSAKGSSLIPYTFVNLSSKEPIKFDTSVLGYSNGKMLKNSEMSESNFYSPVPTFIPYREGSYEEDDIKVLEHLIDTLNLKSSDSSFDIVKGVFLKDKDVAYFEKDSTLFKIQLRGSRKPVEVITNCEIKGLFNRKGILHMYCETFEIGNRDSTNKYRTDLGFSVNLEESNYYLEFVRTYG